MGLLAVFPFLSSRRAVGPTVALVLISLSFICFDLPLYVSRDTTPQLSSPNILATPDLAESTLPQDQYLSFDEPIDGLSAPQAGIATVLDGEGIIALDKHPILSFIERARTNAMEIEEKRNRIKTVEDAVLDYREAFGMDPPEGFEAWFNLARSLNSTTAPSLIPLAHTSVLPFLALPPHLLRQRVRGLLKYQAMGAIEIGSPGSSAGEEVTLLRADEKHVKSRPTPFDWFSIIRDDYHRLPPSQNESDPVQLAIWVDDASFRMTDGDLVAKAEELARAGEVWDIEELIRLEKESESHRSWASTCPSSSRPEISHINPVEPARKRFITDMSRSMNYCDHPELLRLNGELLMRDELPMRPFAPVLVITRAMNGADMVGPPTERVDEFVENPKPWNKKTDSRLLFRGQATGIYHIDRFAWRLNQRDRLSFLGHPKEDKKLEVLTDRSAIGGSVRREKWNLKDLVKKYLNVGLVKQNEVWNCAVSGPQRFACGVDPLIWLPNCPGSGKACEEMLEEHVWERRINRDDSQYYKFILDVDGYGWSSRWRKELSMGSVIIKTTIYNEWWTEQSVPWYHYVPGLYDYSDLFDILAFFSGTPDGESPGRDDLAEEIARQGREFARDRLRWEDIRSYLFLLVLEYRRAWSDDRQQATFKL